MHTTKEHKGTKNLCPYDGPAPAPAAPAPAAPAPAPSANGPRVGGSLASFPSNLDINTLPVVDPNAFCATAGQLSPASYDLGAPTFRGNYANLDLPDDDEIQWFHSNSGSGQGGPSCSNPH